MSLLEEFQKTSLTATFLGKSPGRMYVVKRDGKQEEVPFHSLNQKRFCSKIFQNFNF